MVIWGDQKSLNGSLLVFQEGGSPGGMSIA